MKARCLLVSMLVALAWESTIVMADQDDQQQRSATQGTLQWRLGAARGWAGHEIYFRAPGQRNWRQAPGTAIDVSDGWVVGTDRRNGGYGIYRWNGRDWQRMPGAGIDIGGTYSSPWVINDRGERFTWTGNQWREERNFRQRDNRGRNERISPPQRREAYKGRNRNQNDRSRNQRNNRNSGSKRW